MAATEETLNTTTFLIPSTTPEYTGVIEWSPGVAILMAVIACIGTAGNLLIIGAVFLEQRLRMRGNVFIVNLAVADFIVTAYIMPIGVATSQYKIKPFSDALCDFNAVLMVTTCLASTGSLMMIAIDRYVNVCKLSWYDKLFTKRTVGFYVAMIWIYALIWAIQGWTGWTRFYFGHDFFLCFFYGPASMSYATCLAVFGVVLPVSVLTFCYVSIYRAVKRSRKSIESHHKNAFKSGTVKDKQYRSYQSREKRFILMLVVIVIVFCLCWAPGGCVLMASGMLGEYGVPTVAYTITIWIALCNSALNSIIYGIMNTNFRRGYSDIARRIFCCCCERRKRCHGNSSSTGNLEVDTRSRIKSNVTECSNVPSKNKSPESNRTSVASTYLH